MVVIIKIGRRIPKAFFKGLAYRAGGFLTFQENIWLIIGRAMQMAKNACEKNKEELVEMTIEKREENDGMYYKFQWLIIKVSSIFPEKEREEYNAFMRLYEKLGVIKNILNKDIATNADFSKPFKESKVMTEAQWEDAKKAGYGAMENKDIASKLLEMGIITHAEWRPDKDAVGLKRE